MLNVYRNEETARLSNSSENSTLIFDLKLKLFLSIWFLKSKADT